MPQISLLLILLNKYSNYLKTKRPLKREVFFCAEFLICAKNPAQQSRNFSMLQAKKAGIEHALLKSKKQVRRNYDNNIGLQKTKKRILQ